MEQEFLRDIVSRLDASGVLYAVTGSLASSFWGIPRTTHDVDVVAVLAAADQERILVAFGDCYYLSEAALQDAISRQSMFNIVDSSKALKADVWVSRDDPFSQALLRRRHRVEILPGQPAYIASPEDVLLHKLVWNSITPSERQLADAAGIAAVQTGKLDLDYMRSWAVRQSTLSLLEEVLQGKYLKAT